MTGKSLVQSLRQSNSLRRKEKVLGHLNWTCKSVFYRVQLVKRQPGMTWHVQVCLASASSVRDTSSTRRAKANTLTGHVRYVTETAKTLPGIAAASTRLMKGRVNSTLKGN